MAEKYRGFALYLCFLAGLVVCMTFYVVHVTTLVITPAHAESADTHTTY